MNFLSNEKPTYAAQNYDAIVVFGGLASTAEGLGAEFAPEIAFIESAIIATTPVLGICLGGQILSDILGAPVRPTTSRSPEIGFVEITPTSSLVANFWSQKYFFQWHWDSMPCPTDAINLGRTAQFECQAYELGNAIALQFHPDATPQTISSWIDVGANTIARHSDKTREEHYADAFTHESGVQKWTSELMRSLLERKARI